MKALEIWEFEGLDNFWIKLIKNDLFWLKKQKTFFASIASKNIFILLFIKKTKSGTMSLYSRGKAYAFALFGNQIQIGPLAK